MKKLLFATALLTALFLSACGSQKADSNDLANQPATRPEEGAELDPEFSVDGEDTGETAEPQPDAELSEMVDAIYNVQPVDLMGMETVAIDLTDESWYGYLAGLTRGQCGQGGCRSSQRADDRKPGVQPGAAAPKGQGRCPRDRRFDGGKHQYAQVGLRGGR